MTQDTNTITQDNGVSSVANSADPDHPMLVITLEWKRNTKGTAVYGQVGAEEGLEIIRDLYLGKAGLRLAGWKGEFPKTLAVIINAGDA